MYGDLESIERQWQRERRQKAKQLRAAGLEAWQIEERLGIRDLKGLTRGTRKTSDWETLEIKKLRELVREGGRTYDQLAAMMGRTRGSIAGAIKRYV